MADLPVDITGTVSEFQEDRRKGLFIARVEAE
jgi:hypothetical protein